MSLVALALAFVCSEDPAVAAATGPALHWPRWRGPTWDGVAAPDASPPFAWSETENLVWKVALPGLGNSTPVVAGDRLYLTAALDLGVASGSAPGQVPSAPQPGPPKAGTMHRSVVLALDRATGRELWRTTVHEGVPHEKGHTTGSHASPSPRSLRHRTRSAGWCPCASPQGATSSS